MWCASRHQHHIYLIIYATGLIFYCLVGNLLCYQGLLNAISITADDEAIIIRLLSGVNKIFGLRFRFIYVTHGNAVWLWLYPVFQACISDV